MEDESNEDESIPRNLLRHKVMPVLKQLNPALGEAGARLATLLRDDSEALCDMAQALCDKGMQEESFYLPCSELLAVPKAVASRALLFACRKLAPGVLLQHSQMDALLNSLSAEGGRRQHLLPGRLCAVVRYGQCRIVKQQPMQAGLKQVRVDELPFTLSLPSGGQLHLELVRSEAAKRETDNQKNIMTAALDYDKIKGSLVIRGRKEQDAYPPAGFAHHRSVKKMMVDEKIPAEQRDALPMLCMEDEVLWCAGLRPNHRYRAQSDAARVLLVKIVE